VLNELARDAKIGIELHQRAIPVLEDVYGACELLGLDPLYVANEGVFIAVVASEAADALLEMLREDDNGVNAAIIGEVVETHPRQVVMQSAIGGKRVVNMPVGEQLPRIC
jgi:hydrogenase expression/formation protein HypE